jgi:Flp pilus assembly protein TadG
MRAFAKAGSLARRFADDRRGNFAVLTGISLAAITMAVGLAVDVGQSMHLKSGLRSALDAAILSTAYDVTTGRISIDEAQATAEKFLRTNGQGSFSVQGEYVLLPLIVDKNARTIRGTAYANVDLAFPVFGTKNPRVSVTSEALYSDKQIEVAMMLDVTGSMAKDRNSRTDKIGDLKKAAANAVKTMLTGQDPRNPRIRVALVPYASGVNVGDLGRNIYFEPKNGSDLPPVEDSRVLKKATGTGKLPSYMEYARIVADEFPRPYGAANCATERKDKSGKADLGDDAPDAIRTDRHGKRYYAMVNRDDHLAASGMNACPDAEIIPLTADADALLESIGDFEANGFTAGAIAIQWTYYMLSWKWRDTIRDAGFGDGPADRNPKKLSKVAILMTDGQFNTAFAGAEGNYNSQGDLARRNAVSLCRNMRADGIEIFAIGFDLDNQEMPKAERDAAKKVLRDCASTVPSATTHYFEASTGEELDAAFQAIIANTERVALTK